MSRNQQRRTGKRQTQIRQQSKRNSSNTPRPSPSYSTPPRPGDQKAVSGPGVLTAIYGAFSLLALGVAYWLDITVLAPLICIVLIIGLILLSLAPQYRAFRDEFPDFVRILVVPAGIAFVGVIAAVLLTGIYNEYNDKKQVKQLLEAARRIADDVRIQAQSSLILYRDDPKFANAFDSDNLHSPDRFFQITSEPIVTRTISERT
jgi:Flp pilus assembly protein TadB